MGGIGGRIGILPLILAVYPALLVHSESTIRQELLDGENVRLMDHRLLSQASLSPLGLGRQDVTQHGLFSFDLA